ncbi:MAG TPA: magnesium/cobalt transporter CorA [Bacteroidales bacterium]|nr:magnesium/cobalt transporter CorA [Bacteroidales bacterium]
MKQSILKTLRISRLIPKTAKPPSIPGMIKYYGKEREDPVTIHIIDYNETDFSEKDLGNIAESLPFKESPSVTWLNITGVHDEKVIHEIGEIFKIHPLVLEDIANTTHRPKVEEYDNYLFVIIKMAYYKEETGEVIIEQVSLIIGRNYVISLQEKEGDILDGLRERIRNNKGKIRKQGSDYLMYGIMDVVVDNYFLVLEHIGEDIEEMEEQLMKSATQQLLNRIYTLKQELVYVRKSIWPMREVINTIQRTEYNLVKKDTFVYFRDVYDHTIQVVETVETFRDMSSGMLDLYLSTVSNKMNEVMKVLTIFAAIFIPLTFLAGVYGMNFEFMPELKWKFGYPFWWAFTIIVTIGMLIYFKKKKWL